MSKRGIFDIQLSEVGKMGVPIEKKTDKPEVKRYKDSKRTKRS